MIRLGWKIKTWYSQWIRKHINLSSSKIDKYVYLTSKEIIPSNWSQIIEQAKIPYSSLRKSLEKQTKKQESINLFLKMIK